MWTWNKKSEDVDFSKNVNFASIIKNLSFYQNLFLKRTTETWFLPFTSAPLVFIWNWLNKYSREDSCQVEVCWNPIYLPKCLPFYFKKRLLCSYCAITNLLSLLNTSDSITFRKQIIFVSLACIKLSPKLRLYKKEFSFIISVQR